jgi:hypothetical protein
VQPGEQQRERRLGDACGRRQRFRERGQALVREKLLDERVEHRACRFAQVHDERRNTWFRGPNRTEAFDSRRAHEIATMCTCGGSFWLFSR